MSILQYDGFDTELAMAYGDVFNHAEVSPLALADFAARCGIDRKFMRGEGQRLAKLAGTAAVAQADDAAYESQVQQAFVKGIAGYVTAQAQRLTQFVADAARLKDAYR